ncbi:MAG: 16S rRNA (cytidine(1402)-2'-O)-methyltransferase [Chloroflexi bacterium]|nr:16S rRNA (cytidine(1402)-2'-O)-methyltransferase [Chloroflexota bacterium]
MPTLYLVATPIGNLEDITLRALRVLREVPLIAAEDTRKARRLLTAHRIRTPLTSYHEHNKLQKLPHLLDKLEASDLALVSEAGMPGISDPGYELVRAAVARGIPVVPVPGPSALTSALAVSGLPTAPCLYLGFLPRRAGERRRLLASLAGESRTLLAFEAPHRLRPALGDILTALGDRELAVCRELTKLHEEVFRGTVSQAQAHFAAPRGEFTLVIGGAKEMPQGVTESAVASLRAARRQGLGAREAVAQAAAATGAPKRELYRAWLKLRKDSPRSSQP